MKKVFTVFSFLLFTFANSQTHCESDFMTDTMYLPSEKKILKGEYVQTVLKDLSTVRLFKTDNDRLYLKLVVTRNFYFDKIDVLEIRSGNKSYYAKDTKQYMISKTSGMFVIEIFRNYLATLRDEGITSLVFAKAETDFTRQDARLVKKISRCFYEAVYTKK